jgi:hypothetical protein
MKIWLTYSYEDREFVQKLQNHLKEAGLEILNVENEVLPGDNIIESIYRSISKAEMIFVILSNNSDKKWFSTELGIIISEIRNNKSKKIIPILLDKNAEIPPFINQYQFLDVSDKKDLDSKINRLISTIQTRENNSTSSDEDINHITKELLITKEELLKREYMLYEKQHKAKQRLFTLTFLTTIFASLLTIVSFLFASQDFLPFKIESTVVKTVLSTFLGFLGGLIFQLILSQLKRK